MRTTGSKQSRKGPAACPPSAAYIYILELDPPALAWEYLRRNPAYRRDWQQSALQPTAYDPFTWLHRHPEDPSFDARIADIDWIARPSSGMILTECQHSISATEFSIWKIPGTKAAYCNGETTQFSIRSGARPLRLSLGRGVRDGSPFAFQIPAGVDPRPFCPTISQLNAWLCGRESGKRTKPCIAIRPTRDAVLHMRTLQALDADAAGATHRQIAEAIFGANDVWQRWDKDSELRSLVRTLLRRGRKLVDGGYRQLLTRN